MVRTPSLSAAATGLATFIIFFWILQHMRRRNSRRFPPGPYPWPIIGNLHQLSLPAHRALKILAGVESTATTKEWAMSELLRHPHAMKRLQAEIEWVVGKHRKVNESDLATMKYLHCVVRETLRLYPGGPLAVPHESAEAVTGGYDIPKKTMLMVNLWAIGRNPNVWGEDASEFKPERFIEELGGHNDYTDVTSTQDFGMLPFGAGRRGCPGAPLAIPTISLALAQLLHIFKWTVEGDPSQLDMQEAIAASMPREIPLFAFPSLRFPLSFL